MSKKEITNALIGNLQLTENLEKDPGRKCKRFYEIIHSIRVTTQIITELLKRIENLEEQINNLKLEKNEKSSNNNI